MSLLKTIETPFLFSVYQKNIFIDKKLLILNMEKKAVFLISIEEKVSVFR